MPKFQKDPGKESKLRDKQTFNEDFAFRSLVITTIFGVACFIVSIFFNVVEIFNIFNLENDFFNIIDLTIRTSVLLLFFFFMMISLGNYKDLLGKPSNWKEIAFLFVLSLLQTMRNIYVFGFTLLGLIILLFYFYLIQDS
jgi:hypothetical protein